MSVRLPHSDVATTPLGFGCAYLAGGWEAARSRDLVAAAFEAGFRHFDVAPPYGLGGAEDVLGAALVGRRDRVTLASKVGLPRPDLALRTQIIRFLATPARRYAGPLIRRRAAAASGPEAAPGTDFSLQAVEASITETLRRLRVDHLDCLLLHEACPADVSQELLALLDRKRRDGIVRSLGVASSPESVGAITRACGGFFDVAQYSWSPLDPPGDPEGRLPAGLFHITHRTLMYAFEPLLARLAADPHLAARLSSATGFDLADGAILSRVLLGAALAHNRGGVVLVGTRRRRRIFENAAAGRDPRLIEAGAALIGALAAERAAQS